MRTENVAKLKAQIEEARVKLLQVSDEEMRRVLGPGLWSGKEILGHLTDSAAMNRQRIVRSQYEDLYDFPGYEQATWVSVQAYARYAWSDLVSFFVMAYRHLVHLLENLPEGKEDDRCPVRFADSDYVTLDWLVGHMYRHNDHHLQQIFWLVGKSNLPDDRELDRPIEKLPKRR